MAGESVVSQKEKLARCQRMTRSGLFYIRFMDDILVLASIFGWFAGPKVIGLAIVVMALGVSLFVLVRRKQHPSGRGKAWR